MNAAVKAEQITMLDLEPIADQLPVVQQPAPASVAVNSPAALMLQAMSQGASLEQVEKMMDLQERWETREAEKAFNEAMAAFKSEKVEVLKRKRVEFKTREGDITSYSHAELSDVTEAVGPALARHGFSYRWDVKQEKSEITVTCILKHAKGHSESVTMSAPPDDSGKKNSIQKISSATTYLQRYTLKAITGVAEKGQDDDGQAGGMPEDPEIDALVDWMGVAARGDIALRKHYNENVPTQDFWTRFGPKLKTAARKADQERAE